MTSEPAATPRHRGWVRGSVRRQPDQLVPFLREAAQHRARRALRLYKSEDPMDLLDAGADAGGAVELLAKACIASVEPALLAKGSQGMPLADTVLRLRGHGYSVTADPKVTTIDAAHAVDLAVKLFPRLDIAARGARQALDVRNDSQHMGVAEEDAVDGAVAGMARFVHGALSVLGVTRAEFWAAEDDALAADQAVSSRLSQVADVVEAKIAHAAARYAQWVLRVGEDTAKQVAAALVQQAQAVYAGDPGFDYECPACSHMGWTAMDVDFDVEPDGDGGYSYSQTGQWVVGFRCPVCHLDLSGEECEEYGLGPAGADEDDREDEF